jgi:hypothetical protein
MAERMADTKDPLGWLVSGTPCSEDAGHVREEAHNLGP